MTFISEWSIKQPFTLLWKYSISFRVARNWKYYISHSFWAKKNDLKLMAVFTFYLKFMDLCLTICNYFWLQFTWKCLYNMLHYFHSKLGHHFFINEIQKYLMLSLNIKAIVFNRRSKGIERKCFYDNRFLEHT